MMPMTAIRGNYRFIRTGFYNEACHGRRVAEGGLNLLGEVNALDRRVKRFDKHILSFQAPPASHTCNL
jgi:hypothetical protein